MAFLEQEEKVEVSLFAAGRARPLSSASLPLKQFQYGPSVECVGGVAGCTFAILDTVSVGWDWREGGKGEHDLKIALTSSAFLQVRGDFEARLLPTLCHAGDGRVRPQGKAPCCPEYLASFLFNLYGLAPGPQATLGFTKLRSISPTEFPMARHRGVWVPRDPGKSLSLARLSVAVLFCPCRV